VSEAREIARAIALDRAYQISGQACRGCGLPAVRLFGDGQYSVAWFACRTCVPAREKRDLQADESVDTIADLELLTEVRPERQEGKRIDFFSVLVRSVERTYEHIERRKYCVPRLVVDGVSCVASRADGFVWKVRYELHYEPPRDLPNAKAVERLLAVANASDLAVESVRASAFEAFLDTFISAEEDEATALSERYETMVPATADRDMIARECVRHETRARTAREIKATWVNATRRS
jgi:hypothetical protein